ncbi:MAG: TonB C-terminal domain-containing protein [Myxococcales bacterium]|nr:TonB C-terminal domain-containing protein [Myxococcales bacterium]MCB9707525.1 TonB C-terminal domain-containing protein [Myxococcales bacterium]
MQVGMFMAGSALSLLVHGIIVAAFVLSGLLGGMLPARAKKPIEERTVIEARLVQLGKEIDPRQLPNRQVPLLQTAPPDTVAVSDNPEETPEQPTEQKPPNPTEDLLTRLGDRAQTFAELAEEREKEGSPEGVADGSSQAKAGDVYAGKLYQFFRRGWTVPTVITDAESQKLAAEVDVDITNDLKIGKFTLRRSSGNSLFDQSVLDNLARLKDADATLPEPPPEVAATYVGQTVGLLFRGRDAG